MAESNANILSPISTESVPGPISGLKLVGLDDRTTALVFSGSAAPNGALYNSALEETPISSGRTYTALFETLEYA
jgi:hypothetical protein